MSSGESWLLTKEPKNQRMPSLLSIDRIGSSGKAAVRSHESSISANWAMRSSLTNSSNNRYRFHYREKVGLRIALIEFIVYVVVMILLTAIPHAILLSVTGQLFPSSFSSSFIPSLSFVITIMSLTYGVASGTIDSVVKMHKILVGGLEVGSKFIPTYVIGIQLYMSVIYVFIL